MELTSADLAPIRELYGRGLYLQAFERARSFGPFKEWSNTPARLLAGRLVIQLGAPRLGRWLHLRAFRDTPSHHEAIYYHARYRLEQFGPLATWRFLRRHPEWHEAAPEVRADWYGLHGFVAARLRDFDRAERWLNRAESITHDRAWLCIERAAAYEFAERYEQAMECARRSLELNPWFRPGVQALAHLLQLQGREREAIDLLQEAATHIESGIIVAHLAGIQLDLQMYNDAQRSYDRYAELSPLQEPEVLRWLHARRADVKYFLGDYAAVPDLARAAGERLVRPAPYGVAPKPEDQFYPEFADRVNALLAGGATEPVRIRLDQAGPDASPRFPTKPFPLLPTLASYWGVTTEKPPVEGTTYDGLPDPRERRWATNHGLEAIEFTVTPDAAMSLIERGIPFVITFVDAGYTHSQLVLGFDRYRYTLWLRDPGERRAHESPLGPLMRRYASVGPRGLILLPPDQLGRLDGLTLQDRALYDLLAQLQEAWLDHDRERAAACREELLARAPEHRLARLGRLAISRYDNNPTQILQALESLLELHPDDTTWLLSKISALRDLGRREERLKLARAQVARRDGDPIFSQHFAQMMMTDPRYHDEAVMVMRDAIRRRPYAAAGYYILANILWEQREFHEATDLYRFAASLDERDEQFAEGYFRAARVLEQTPEAMRFLQMRYNRTRGRLSASARALFYALSEQDEMASAFNVLDQAGVTGMELLAPREATEGDALEPSPEAPPPSRSELADILLFNAEMRTCYNEPERGEELLAQANDYAERTTWLRTAARIATIRCDLPRARSYWEEFLTLDPINVDGYRNLARIIADLEGREATVAWLRTKCDRFPYLHPLLQLMIDWLRGEPSAAVEDNRDIPALPIIRRMIANCPEDAWAHRELALHLANHGRPEEGLPYLEIARTLEPDSPSYFYTLGHVYHKADRIDDAKAAYEETIRRSVDNDVAISEIVSLARGEEEKKEVLQFIAEQFKEQPNFGDGLLTFREQAVHILEPDDLLRILRDLLDDHGELWQCWSMTIQQLIVCQRLEEANALAKEAVQRFPLLPRLWVDLAEVRQAQNDREGQIEAMREAVHVSPGWNYAARELAEALEAEHRNEEARVVLEQAVARSPLDPVNHGYLADNLWNANEGKEALDRLKVALRLDPGYDWAWRALGNWSERVDPPEDPVDTAREVTQLRPGDPRAWLALVRMLHGPQYHEEALHALDRAIALNPKLVEAYDLKAERLAEMGRFDEAKATAMPRVFENDPPMVLQGRAAWVEARRGRYDVACREMRALVTLEPSYYWGWQQLAEWYNETGKVDEYLEAAEKLTELRPDSPVALAMRGEAKLRTEDREGGKSDLREAQKMAPDYSFAGMLLFDAYLEDEEFDNARSALAMLQEHIGDSGRPFVAARHAQLAVRMKDKDAALDALRDTCVLPCDSTWPINTAVNECRSAGWSEEVDEVLRKVLEEEPEFHPYTLFVWLDGPDGQKTDQEERLSIVNRVISIHPRDVRPYDIKAEILTRLQRYDEALAACKPEILEPNTPLILRGRSAWILAQRGDREGAIAKMRQILNTDADYYWGWQQIANWYDAQEAHSEYLEAAENLVRLAPNDPAAYGYRGEAKLFGGDRRGAKADFQKAFELDPNYAFAGLHLIDEQLVDEELENAQITLSRLQEHIGGPYVALRAVRLAVRQKDQDEACKQFLGMCKEEEATYLLLNKAADALSEAGWKGPLEKVLDEAVDKEDVVSHVGRLWAERCAARRPGVFENKLNDLLVRGPVGKEALASAIDVLAVPGQRARLHGLIERFGDDLRENPRIWARTADSLVRVGDLALAVKWTADWKERAVSEPWMLYSAAYSRRMLLQTDEAYDISRSAIKLSESDPSVTEHQIWVALEDALAGRTEDARKILDDIDEEELDDIPRLMFQMAEALTDVQQADATQKAAVFQKAKSKVEASHAAIAPKENHADLSHSYRRWVMRIAADRGGFLAWLWSRWTLWFRIRSTRRPYLTPENQLPSSPPR